MTRVWRGLVLVVRLELRMYAGLLRLVLRRPGVPEGATPHRYVGAVAALLWGFTGVSAVELVVLHLVIPWEPARLLADVVGVWGLVWVAGLTACHYVYPHVTTADALWVRRPQAAPVLELPWADIVSVSTREAGHESSRELQVDADGTTLLVVVGSRTNLELVLRSPRPVVVRGTSYDVSRVRLFADDARGLAAELRQHVTASTKR